METLRTKWLLLTILLTYHHLEFINGENYTLTLLYPISNVQLVSVHYFGAFIAAIEDMNQDSLNNGYDIHLNYNIADTVEETYFNKAFTTPEWSSLKIIGNKSQEGTDAFIGPGFQTCACAATTTAAYNKAMVGYVSGLLFLSSAFNQRHVANGFMFSVCFRSEYFGFEDKSLRMST